MHAAVDASSRLPSLLTSAPTCAHVMPRHGYVSSIADLTVANVGYVPASYRPNFMLSLTVVADAGLQYDTIGSTDAAKTAPSAAFFCERSVGTKPILYA